MTLENIGERRTMDPLISVITLTYNHEDYIGQCIESVLNQTFEDWEMLIIDDGSTDRTPDIIASYDDDRIRYFQQENVGIWRLSETYNKGLKLAKGKYIAFLDGDDYWPPYKLERQLHAFDNENIVLTYGKYMLVNAEGKKFGKLGLLPKENLNNNVWKNKPRGKILEKILCENIISVPTVMCRKKSLIQIGGFKQSSGIRCVDYLTELELSLVGEFVGINEILGYYRRHSTQMSQKYTADIDIKEAEARFQFCENFYERLPSKIKNRLNINKRVLQQKLRKKLGQKYSDIGRVNLLSQNWAMSRRCFALALKKASFRTKILALLGLGLSLMKKNLELILKMRGAPGLR